jgi:hypothetical protein
MRKILKVGEVYTGAVTGEKFTVLFVGKRHPTAKDDEVKLLCGSSKQIWESVNTIQYLIQTGGLKRV